MIPDFKTFIKESIWSDIQDRSMGKTVRKEDAVNNLDRNEFYDYLKNKYNKFTHLISKDPSEIHIKLGWSYFPQRDYIIDIHWVEKNEIKNLYLNFGPCELNTLCHKNFKIGTSNDGISNEEILNIIDFCLDYISSHKEIESPLNESIWSDIQDRSMGKTIREEDKITTNEDLQKKIQELYKEQGEGETLDVSSLTDIIKCDDFSNIFKGYPRVEHIIGLEDWDVSNVESMKCMFMGCGKFSSDLSKWDVSNVEDMAAMFWGCNNFNSDLSKWNVSSVGDMDSMFWNCKKFNSDLSKWDVSSVTYMGDMFEGCEIFNSNLSKWNVSEVLSTQDMFQDCKNFNSDLSNWDVSKVINMSYMFDGCKKFNSDLSNWNVSVVENMEYMFKNCDNFNSDLSKWNVSIVGDMEGMFDGCKSLKQIPSWYMNRDLNESIWSDIQDRSMGKTVRTEDDINLMDIEDFKDYILRTYEDNWLSIGGGDDFKSLTLDIFRTQIPNGYYNTGLKIYYDFLGKNIDIIVCRLINKIDDNIFEEIKQKYNLEVWGKTREATEYKIYPKNPNEKMNNSFVIKLARLISTFKKGHTKTLFKVK